jgi:hypothetical protein
MKGDSAMETALASSTPQIRIQLDLPGALYQWLSREAARRSVTVDQLTYQLLERYAQSEGDGFDITQTQTWQMCGALSVAEPESAYVVGRDAEGHAITNYAEHVDDVVYRNR